MNKALSRRTFLRNSSRILGRSCVVLTTPMVLSACKEVTNGASEFKIFSIDEGAEYAAIAARIVPSDESPGASEAGVVFF